MRVSFGVAAIAVVACGPVVATDEGSTSGADASGEGPSDATATTAGTTATSTSAGTTATSTSAGTTMSTGTAADTTSATSTTGEPASCETDWVSGCQSYCAQIVTCDPEEGAYEQCVKDCMLDLGDMPPECQPGFCEAFTCYGGLPCNAGDAEYAPCDELWNQAEGCDTGACLIGVSADGTCDYACLGQTFSCDAVTCTCYEGGTATTSCPADGICGATENLDVYASACCGW